MLQVYTARLGDYYDAHSLIITPAEGRGRRARAFDAPAEAEAVMRKGIADARDLRGHARNIEDAWGATCLRRTVWWRYVQAYERAMRASYRAHRATWRKLLAQPEVTFLCDCADADFCHRTILAAAILPTFGAVYRGERPIPQS